MVPSPRRQGGHLGLNSAFVPSHEVPKPELRVLGCVAGPFKEDTWTVTITLGSERLSSLSPTR